MPFILGGAIRVASRPEKGSTFTLTVETGPLRDIPLVDVPNKTELPTTPIEGQIRSPARPCCRVLQAEDGPDNRRLFAFILKKAGADVTVADRPACSLHFVRTGVVRT